MPKSAHGVRARRLCSSECINVESLCVCASIVRVCVMTPFVDEGTVCACVRVVGAWDSRCVYVGICVCGYMCIQIRWSVSGL